MKPTMKLKRSRQIATGVVVSLVALTATVAHAERKSPGERAVEYRQSLYQVILGNFGPVEDMASGKAPFDAAKAQKYSQRVAFLARMLDDAFPANSNGVGKTDALPEIWKDPAAFQTKAQAFIDKSQALADAVKGGDMAAIKSAGKDVGESCKACHEKFKRKED